MGSNADLPIVGGSILNHDHFQGGHYTFPMDKAPIRCALKCPDPQVEAGILDWPMSALALTGTEPARLIELADKLLCAWRNYSDPACEVYAETEGQPHNTVTPILRRVDGKYRLLLVLRNNRTSAEHPLGIFHPHAPLHHIKKENIGLIEVMGLAVLPARLKAEMAAVADALVTGADLRRSELTAKHAGWTEGFRDKYDITEDNAQTIVRRETGLVFAQVLEDAGVYKRTPEGREAFFRFLRAV